MQFGQWLSEQQGNLVKVLWEKQKQAQESLVRELCQSLRRTNSTSGGAKGGNPPNHYHLSKLTPEDDTEAYLYAFEATATAANWSAAQWVTILGPYLTSPAQIVLRMILTQDVLDYQRVNAAVFDRYEVTETRR